MDAETIWLKDEEFLKKADERFLPLIEKYGHCTLCPAAPEKYYISLLKAILRRELPAETAQAALTVIEKRCGEVPRPKDLLESGFVDLNLPVRIIAKLRTLTEKILAREVPLDKFPKMEDSAIRTCLRHVPGLGRWTAEMFLILVMANPDVFPSKDHPLQKGLQEFYGLSVKPKNTFTENPLTESWRPWRILAVWYLWQAYGEQKAAAGKARGTKKTAGKGEKVLIKKERVGTPLKKEDASGRKLFRPGGNKGKEQTAPASAKSVIREPLPTSAE